MEGGADTENWLRRLPEVVLTILVSALATILATLVISLFVHVPQWGGELPLWLQYLAGPAIFLILLLCMIVVVWWVLPARIGVALVSQRPSTPLVLLSLEVGVLLGFLGWLFLTTNIFASPPGASSDLIDTMTRELNHVESLPTLDYTILLILLISGLLTLFLWSRMRTL